MDTIDVGGHWWLPERPEHRVPGWLSYSLSEGLQLRLIGRLRDYHDDHVGEYPRVLGDTEKHQFTLEQCHRARYSNVLGDRGTETIRVGQAFRGCWYEPGEDAGGDSITMLLRHLVHWVRPKSINVSQTNGTMLTASVAQLPAIELHSPHGVITLAHVFRTDGDGQSGLGIEQDVWLTHDAGEVRHASKLLETTGVVRDLISLAADRTATIEGVSIYHPDVGADGASRENRRVRQLDRRSRPSRLEGVGGMGLPFLLR